MLYRFFRDGCSSHISPDRVGLMGQTMKGKNVSNEREDQIS